MQGAPLVIFSIGFFFSISYSTISLYTYGVSKDVEQVEEAEMNEEWRTESGERRTESLLPQMCQVQTLQRKQTLHYSLFTLHLTAGFPAVHTVNTT